NPESRNFKIPGSVLRSAPGVTQYARAPNHSFAKMHPGSSRAKRAGLRLSMRCPVPDALGPRPGRENSIAATRSGQLIFFHPVGMFGESFRRGGRTKEMKKPVVGVIGNSHRVENRFQVQMVGERNLRAIAEVSGGLPLMFAGSPDITDIGALLDAVDG